jgi:GxxExxY protein
MEIEFAKAGIPYVREDPVRIYYDGKPLPTVWRADFTCFDREFIVELKAIKTITKIEWAQVVHYLRATRIPHALLVNFGRPTLQYDTFDLDRLPSATSPDAPAPCGEAAATNITLQEESGSMARSTGEALAEPF